MKLDDLVLESFETTTTKIGLANKNLAMVSKIDTMNAIKDNDLADAKQFILKFNKDIIPVAKKWTIKLDTMLLKAIDQHYAMIQKSYSAKFPGKFLPEEIKASAYEMILSVMQQQHIADMKLHLTK